MISSMRALFGAFFAVLLCASPAAASQDYLIGSFSAVGDEPNIKWTRFEGYKDGGSFSSIGESRVFFTFGDGSEPYSAAFAPGLANLASLGALEATMVITGPAAPYYSEYGYQTTMSFSFIYAGADPLDVNGQTFNTGANLYSTSGFSTGQANWYTSAIHSSDLVDLSLLTGNAYSNLNLGFTPPLVYKDWAPYGEEWIVENYEARLGSMTFFASVPEPETWALLITGFGLAGAALRSRRRPATV